jgi:hypothetical protein
MKRGGYYIDLDEDSTNIWLANNNMERNDEMEKKMMDYQSDGGVFTSSISLDLSLRYAVRERNAEMALLLLKAGANAKFAVSSSSPDKQIARAWLADLIDSESLADNKRKLRRIK